MRTLERTLGLFPATNIVIANMIGAGIFTTSGLLMADLRDPLLMILLWIAGGVIALCGALSYGILGAAIPEAGGEYAFLSRLYHPSLGFLSGWVSFVVGFSAPIAASALGFSEYFSRAFPAWLAPLEAAGLRNPATAKQLLAIAVIAAFTLVHLRGIRPGARVQNSLTFLKVVLILGLLCLGFFWGRGDFGHFAEREASALDFSRWKTIGLSLMWIMFAYSGWNASTYIGAEIRNPSRNVPLSLLLGTLVVLFLYLSLNMLFVYALRPDEMAGVLSVGGLAAGQLFGRSMETVVSLLISFALFSSLSAFIMLGPRVYYAMARDGYFFRSIAGIHPRSGVPARAILFQSAISIVMVLSGTFDQILTYMGFSLGIFPILAALGVFRLRPSGRPGRLRVGYPAAALLYAISGFCILTLAFFERPAESSIALGTVVAGVPLYIVFKNRYHDQKDVRSSEQPAGTPP
jgi:APA family basic amino acid/polyamine antiporter